MKGWAHISLCLQDLIGSDAPNKVPACPGVNAVLRQAKAISLVVGDSGRIRQALRSEQQKAYGQAKSIEAHCPTRWAILFKICCSLMATKVCAAEDARARR